MDGFEEVTDLLSGPDLKKASPKDIGLHLPQDLALVYWALQALTVCFSISLCCHFITENINLLQILGYVIFMITGLNSLFAN